ncbi:MAG: RsmB/NOP family class I SAM-dependent RNA methyltransferase [Candidatus Micrarchaeia archaeon]|jgi:NOL1/NOP2/sun family putative RNA methylase
MKKDEFIDYLNSYTDGELAFEKLINQREFFRINTLKTTPKGFLKFSKLQTAKTNVWENAFEYQDKIPIGKTWEYFLGYLHPQSLTSMLPALILNPKEREDVLDLTAAPCGKTTQISAMMRNTGVIVANDVPEKEKSMFGNIKRLGALNIIIITKDAKNFKIRERFDKVLLDAPCSALGGEKAAHLRYTKEMSYSLSTIQKMMILNAFDSVKNGGEMVYSTCTFAKEENEEVIQFLLEKRGEAKLIPIKLDIKKEKGIDGLDDAVRIYPQHLNSEGFFIAKIKKVL